MTQCTNTSEAYRVWPSLVDKTAGTTLGLEAGESTDVGMWVEDPEEVDGVLQSNPWIADLPDDFSDPFLKVVTPPTPPPAAPVPPPAPVQASSPADSKE